MTIAVVPAGGIARVGDRFATYSSYGDFLNELAVLVGGITVYAPVIERGYPEYEYHADRLLDAQYCRVIPLPSHPRGDPGFAILRNYAIQFWSFLRDVRRWRGALVYTPSVTASLAILAWRLVHADPQPVVAYVWGDWEQLAVVLPQRGVLRRLLDPIQKRLLVMQEKWLVRHASVTLVAGPALLRKYSSLGRSVIETAPMIKMDQLSAGEPIKDRAAHQLLFVGRLVPGKGLEILLEALSILRRSFPSASARIIGSGNPNYLTDLRRIAASLGIGDAVEFVGVVSNGPDLWDQYAEATLFVCPSLSEGFPRVLYEAMALGTPIVSSAVGGIPDLLRDRVHALLVPPGDAEKLADACAEILSDGPLASRLAEASRSLFKDVQQRAAGLSPAKRVAELLDRGRLTPARLS